MSTTRSSAQHLAKLGLPPAEIARTLGVTRQRISQILGATTPRRRARQIAFLSANPDPAAHERESLAALRSSIARWLEENRRLQQLSYAEVARRAGWKSAANVHRIAQGDYRSLTLSTLVKVAFALGYDLSITFRNR